MKEERKASNYGVDDADIPDDSLSDFNDSKVEHIDNEEEYIDSDQEEFEAAHQHIGHG